MLARDLVDETFRSGSTCVVITGLLHDPYTAITRILGDCPGEPLPTDPSMADAGGR